MGNMGFQPSRRAFLRGRNRSSGSAGMLLPWLPDEGVTDRCTRCEKCIDACPEEILVRADGGFPGIDFDRGGCVFCGDCAEACPESLFDLSLSPPWNLRARVDEGCLARRGVMCRSCQDACDEDAIEFQLLAHRVSPPAIRADCCTGCGACVSVCPAHAIAIA